jgi:hypothetical protein
MNKSPLNVNIVTKMDIFPNPSPGPKETQDQDPKQDQWQQPKWKKENGKTQSIPTVVT